MGNFFNQKQQIFKLFEGIKLSFKNLKAYFSKNVQKVKNLNNLSQKLDVLTQNNVKEDIEDRNQQHSDLSEKNITQLRKKKILEQKKENSLKSVLYNDKEQDNKNAKYQLQPICNLKQKKKDSEITADSEDKRSFINEFQYEREQQKQEWEWMNIENEQVTNEVYESFGIIREQLTNYSLLSIIYTDQQSSFNCKNLQIQSFQSDENFDQKQTTCLRDDQVDRSQISKYDAQVLLTDSQIQSEKQNHDIQIKKSWTQACPSQIKQLDLSIIAQKKNFQNSIQQQSIEVKNILNQQDQDYKLQTSQSVFLDLNQQVILQKFGSFKVDTKKLSSLICAQLKQKYDQDCLSIQDIDPSNFFKDASGSKMMIIDIEKDRFLLFLITDKQQQRQQVFCYMDANKRFKKINFQNEVQDETRDSQLTFLCDQFQNILNSQVELFAIKTKQIMERIKKQDKQQFNQLNLERQLKIKNILCFKLIRSNQNSTDSSLLVSVEYDSP